MRCSIKDTTLPTGTATVVLLDTFTALAGITLPTHEIARYTLTVNNTQAFKIQLLESTDGTTYRIFENILVPIPAAGSGGAIADSGPLDFAVQGVQYLKVQVVNNGVDQTTWSPVQELVEKQRAAQV